MLHGQTETTPQGTLLCVGKRLRALKLPSLRSESIAPLIQDQRRSCVKRVQGVRQVGPLHAEHFRRRLNKHQTRSTHLYRRSPRAWLRQASQPAAGGLCTFTLLTIAKRLKQPSLLYLLYPPFLPSRCSHAAADACTRSTPYRGGWLVCRPKRSTTGISSWYRSGG